MQKTFFYDTQKYKKVLLKVPCSPINSKHFLSFCQSAKASWKCNQFLDTQILFQSCLETFPLDLSFCAAHPQLLKVETVKQ